MGCHPHEIREIFLGPAKKQAPRLEVSWRGEFRRSALRLLVETAFWCSWGHVRSMYSTGTIVYAVSATSLLT
jgi:hypothetical protein